MVKTNDPRGKNISDVRLFSFYLPTNIQFLELGTTNSSRQFDVETSLISGNNSIRDKRLNWFSKYSDCDRTVYSRKHPYIVFAAIEKMSEERKIYYKKLGIIGHGS